jgi:hypothetical protein
MINPPVKQSLYFRERNRKIYDLYRSGWSMYRLSDHFLMTTAYIGKIIKETKISLAQQ